jgi:hypothetical protein
VTETGDKDTSSQGELALGHATVEREPSYERVAPLRGSTPVSVGRRSWLFAGALGLVLFSAALVVSFVAITNNNSRVDRMKSRGIAVEVTVTNCAGNLGGSGSNGAGYTCSGYYTVGRVTYREPIGSMVTFAASGTRVRGVVDPSHHGTVVLASAVLTSVASRSAYLATGLLTLVLIVLTLVFLRVARRTRSFDGPSSSETGAPGI